MSKKSSPIKNVAIYARISQDDTGQELGIDRQRKACRRRAGAEGWNIVADLSDNDISAYSGRHRPGYEELLGLVRARQIDAVVVYHMSRLWRARSQRAQALDLFKEAGVSVVAVMGPTLDLSTAYGRAMADVLGTFDTMESDVKAERVTDAARQRAYAGRPNGAIPFGWRRVYERDEKGRVIDSKDVLDEKEAPVVAEICKRLLAGDSLIAVTRWLNELDPPVPAPGASFEMRHRPRGIDNPTGTRWGKTSVKKLALRPQNAGLRLYHAGREDEDLIEMAAEPIISVEEWERLRRLLQDPARSKKKGGARVHLLSHAAVGRCGVCGGLLRHTVRKTGGKEYPLYVCADRGCVGRNSVQVDQWVGLNVAAVLADPRNVDLLVRNDDREAVAARDKLVGLQRRLDDAAEMYAAGDIDAEQLATITRNVRPLVEKAQAELGAAQPDTPFALLEQITAGDAYELWASLPVTQQLLVVETLFERVAIHPRKSHSPKFEETTVQVVTRPELR